MIWVVTSLIVVAIVLFKTQEGVYDVAVNLPGSLSHAPAAQGSAKGPSTPQQLNQQNQLQGQAGQQPQQKPSVPQGQNQLQGSVGAVEEHVHVESEDERRNRIELLKRMPWLAFKHLDGYFWGLKTVVPKSHHVPEYPNRTREAPYPEPPRVQPLSVARPYNPYSTEEKVQTCFLDADEKIPAPDIWAYPGVPQHMPDPTLGSYEIFGIKDDICFDRFGRYGPYGLGYNKEDGGSGVGNDTENSNSERIWAETGKIDYRNVDWGFAQDRCLEKNKDRFLTPDPTSDELKPELGKKGRIAVVIRTYTGFKWTDHAILNFRALINELSLKSGGEYQVHFLMHVRDEDIPIWADDETVQKVLDANMPKEFHGLVTLWSVPQMRLFYPGEFGDAIANPSGSDIHGVYRSAHFPLQVFAMQHPEYEHFWNWEMDMRFLGSYYELFDRIGKWADKQPRPMAWERSARYYVPEHHGSWEDFSATVRNDTLHSGRPTIFGPVRFAGKTPLRAEQTGQSMLPPSCEYGKDKSQCGVGEGADIITLNPIFDVEQSGWVFWNDATGYESPPPRRCAIVTASRLSRRLLSAMHEEVFLNHHTAFSEMFPPTVALHHGLKAIFAPHPIYIDRGWQPLGSSVDAAFNGGRDHSTSGRGSPFDLSNEHNHKGTSWYFNSEFAGLVWRRWLGYAQMDGRDKHGGIAGAGTLRGGREEEESELSTGRLCLRSMLVHPIKFEDPNERK